MMTYSAKTIANFFIKLALREGEPLSSMKLNKLLYIAHGWSLALNHQALLDESVQAWKFGPVIESVYHAFKHFGNAPIDAPTIEYQVDKETGEIVAESDQLDAIDSDTKALLERIWDVYKVYTGVQLSNWTHLSGSPWHQAWYEEHGFTVRSHTITNDLIRDYFKQLEQHNETG